MRKCYNCQQMKGIVTSAKKPDGKPGYICSDCHVESASDWYFWTCNQHCHFIQFRHSDNTVATARVSPLKERFTWKVNGPCWSVYEAEGIADTLDTAKQIVDQHLHTIIAQEFNLEYTGF